LIIGPTPPPYHGVAVSTQLILDSPAFQGFRLVHLDTADRRGIENIGAFEWGNITLGLWHCAKFLGLLARHRPHMVYLPISQGIGGYLRDLMFLLPAQWFGTPTVVHLRGSEFYTFYAEASPLVQVLIRYSLGAVKRAIVLGESLRGMFVGLVPAERIAVVPNGTVDFVASLGRVEKTPGRVRGLFLSNLRPRKGLFVVLDAAIESLRRFPCLEFVFAGEWEAASDRERARALLQDCDVVDRIHFRGRVVGEQKQRLLMESDFFVFPPIEPEGHPRVVLEAMVAGLPIITTGQGAIVETVIDGQTGFVVEQGSAAAIVEKIAYLIENPDNRCRMSQAARQRFLTHYTAEASNTQMARVFAEVLGET
jgi:glycosyltransferase involved in cell wall biosynthesis